MSISLYLPTPYFFHNLDLDRWPRGGGGVYSVLIVNQLYYSTATPGRFYAYYDVTSSRIGASSGNSATIGAQGDSTGELLRSCLPAPCRA